MKKISILTALFIIVAVFVSGCSFSPKANDDSDAPPYISDSISFGERDFYAVAYLGYNDMSNLEFYAQNYLGYERLPIHYISEGEYYLIIPKYQDMALKIYENDIDTPTPTLIFETQESLPFIVRCNISDIFSNVTVSFTYESETFEFSPFISLEDGSVQVGDNGINITKQQASIE